MSKIHVINQNGEKIKDIELSSEIVKTEVNEGLVKDAVVLALACQRQGTKKTKTRAEVRGGGKKPWRQKGTGRARAGSIRSNIWRGGGIAHGVLPQDFSKSMNRKVHKLALRSAVKAKVEDMLVVDSLKLKTSKTKEFLEVLTKLKIADKKVLILLNELNENIILAASNLTNVLLLEARDVNVLDIINNNTILIDEEGLKTVEEVLK